MKKNRAATKRSKSWLCFQFNEPIDLDFKSQPADPVHLFNPKENEPPVTNISSEMNLSRLKRRSSSRGSFSRVMKAVFFETAPKKNRKVQQDPYQALKSLPDFKSSKHEYPNSKNSSRKAQQEEPKTSRRSSKEGQGGDANISASSSNLSNLSTFSSFCSSPSSSSSNLTALSDQKKSFRSNSFELKHFTEDCNKNTKNGVSSINGLYMLLISLVVLIFWGRLCAIICTSTWVYFGRLRRKREEEDEVLVIKQEEQKMESREYKKRVIMEGFLERSHNRFCYQAF